MTIKQQIDSDLKAAMLAGDKVLVTTLRGLKSTILYAEVAANKRDSGLSEEAITSLLQKESKKRQESANLYRQGGSPERADSEETEKKVIEQYLPASLSKEETIKLVDSAIAELGADSIAQMGKVIANVRSSSHGAADGALVAQLVKEKLTAAKK